MLHSDKNEMGEPSKMITVYCVDSTFRIFVQFNKKNKHLKVVIRQAEDKLKMLVIRFYLGPKTV